VSSVMEFGRFTSCFSFPGDVCEFDSSAPQDIKASYILARELGINTSATGGGIETTYRAETTYNLVSQPPPLRLPSHASIEEWITSTRKSTNSGVLVETADGGLLNVSGIDAKMIADNVETIIRCHTGGVVGGCGKGTSTWKANDAVWMWTVRIKNNCGTYLFNMIDAVNSKDESKPPCCLPGFDRTSTQKCAPNAQGQSWNLCPEARLQIV